MKVLVCVFMVTCASTTGIFIPFDEIETHLSKFVLNNSTIDEDGILKDLLEILRLPELVPALLKHKHTDNPVSYKAKSLMGHLRCTACCGIFRTLFVSVGLGLSDELLKAKATILCVLLKIQTRNVCKGAVELNLPIMTYIIRNTPEATPRAFCSLLMQTAHEDVCSHNDERFDWTVNLPPVSESVAAPQTNQRPLKVAILTDVHIDPFYEAYGVANCEEPTCCRKGQIPYRNFIFASDVNMGLYEKVVVEKYGEKLLNLSVATEIRRRRYLSRWFEMTPSAAPAGYWGDYRKCDTPLWAYEDVIDRIAETHQDIDMVYYIGDTIDHGIWETTYDLTKNSNRYLIEKMKTSFGAHVLVVPTIGNHEAQPVNQFAPNYVVGKHNTTWLYEALAEKWDTYLTDEARASLLVRGGYSLRPIPGFKVIVVNNNVPQRHNWWLVFDPLDAKKHLNWLIQELYESELAGEKVHILAHIPPGVEDLTHTWTREYNRIVNRFSSTIAAEFNGHEHSDQFKLFYSMDGSPINVAWGGGGISTYSDYNPNYKIVDIDGSSFEPIRMQSYSYNMTEANLTPNSRPRWFQLYDLKNSFDLPDLSPASIGNLVNLMSAAAGGYYLDLYSAYFSKLSDGRWPQCDQECKINNLCNIVITVLWEREKCMEITSSLLRKCNNRKHDYTSNYTLP